MYIYIYIYVCMIMYGYVYIWVNYNHLTVLPKPGIMVYFNKIIPFHGLNSSGQ